MSGAGELGAWIEGIGLRGPGLRGWAASVEALAGRAAFVREPTVLVPPASLPPAERRRVGKGVKVALEVGFEALAAAARDPSTLPSVFASSSGDGDHCDAICRELAGDRMISPTRFHNSVHNAPSGYWGIASGSMAASTSLSAHDDSFVAGLEDALTQLAGGADAVLLVAYDAPYPEPLFAACPTPDCFGFALVLAREPGPRALAWIGVDAPHGLDARPPTQLDDLALEAIRASIPAARALPLATALARHASCALAFSTARGACHAMRVDAQTQPQRQTRQPECV